MPGAGAFLSPERGRRLLAPAGAGGLAASDGWFIAPPIFSFSYQKEKEKTGRARSKREKEIRPLGGTKRRRDALK